jgi:hypothetical protein
MSPLLDEGAKGSRLAHVLHRPWLFALLVGLVTAGAAGLVSAHNGDPTQIHACVNQAATPRGQVIIYSAPGLPGAEPATSTCGTRGIAVDWSSLGGAGATGASGPSGLPGLTGATGPSGGTGGSGPQGVTGPSGPTGASPSLAVTPLSIGDQNCPTGGVQITVTGGTGSPTTNYVCNGKTGSTGPSGPPGPPGPPGPVGAAGPA